MKLVRKASEMIDSFYGLKVAVLGLTFKPGTDDMREAPSIVNINYLLERGANVYAYDPIGIDRARKIFSDKINYTNNIDKAIEGADMCFIMTEWKEIVDYDLDKYVEKKKYWIFVGLQVLGRGRYLQWWILLIVM